MFTRPEPSESITALASSIHLLTVQPEHGGRCVAGVRREAIVGETFALAVTLRAHAEIVVARRPPTSSAILSHEGRFCPDAPGLYTFRVTLDGGWSREVEIVAFTPRQLDSVCQAGTVGVDRRAVLRSVVNDAKCSPATIAAALESVPSPEADGLSPSAREHARAFGPKRPDADKLEAFWWQSKIHEGGPVRLLNHGGPVRH